MAKNKVIGGSHLSDLNELYKKSMEERLHHEIQWYKNMYTFPYVILKMEFGLHVLEIQMAPFHC